MKKIQLVLYYGFVSPHKPNLGTKYPYLRYLKLSISKKKICSKDSGVTRDCDASRQEVKMAPPNPKKGRR